MTDDMDFSWLRFTITKTSDPNLSKYLSVPMNYFKIRKLVKKSIEDGFDDTSVFCTDFLRVYMDIPFISKGKRIDESIDNVYLSEEFFYKLGKDDESIKHDLECLGGVDGAIFILKVLCAKGNPHTLSSAIEFLQKL